MEIDTINKKALRSFIKENARPVELAMYIYFFENGTSEEVIKELKAINVVKKWSKESAKEGKEDTSISTIWLWLPYID